MSDQATSMTPGSQGDPEAEYGATYYSNYWGGGGPYERNERWLKFFGEVADGIIRDLHPTSVFDAGCAMGFLVEELRKRGVEAWGADISEYAISQVSESVAEYCRVASLSEPLDHRYDLITCIEVLEHVPPAEIDKVIDNIAAATDRLLLSTTAGDFGEPTHLNVQPPEWWAAKLAERGLMRDLERDVSYLSPWAALYVRLEEPRAETVRRYDRAWSRLRREVTEVRDSLLQSQERLAELDAGGGVGSRPDLLGELDRRNEEILKLRDLLIGKDAELGAAKGRAAAFEAQMMQRVNIKNQIYSKVPFLRTLSGLMRRLLATRH